MNFSILKKMVYESLTETKLCKRGKEAAKAKFDKYPSAYANGYAVQVCKGTKPDKSGNKKTASGYTKESLSKWFDEENWKRIDSKGNIAGECGTSKNKKNPDRCLPAKKAYSLSKEERAATAQKKKQQSQGGKKQFVPNTKKAKVKSS